MINKKFPIILISPNCTNIKSPPPCMQHVMIKTQSGMVAIMRLSLAESLSHCYADLMMFSDMAVPEVEHVIKVLETQSANKESRMTTHRQVS